MRVVGIDPGTVSIDVCALQDGRLALDHAVPTASAGPVDLVAGPSGYGLPLTRAGDVTEDELRLAFLAVDGEAGGIGGMRSLARALAASRLPVVFTPGVIHLPSV